MLITAGEQLVYNRRDFLTIAIPAVCQERQTDISGKSLRPFERIEMGYGKTYVNTTFHYCPLFLDFSLIEMYLNSQMTFKWSCLIYGDILVKELAIFLSRYLCSKIRLIRLHCFFTELSQVINIVGCETVAVCLMNKSVILKPDANQV